MDTSTQAAPIERFLLKQITHCKTRAGPGVKNFVRERRRESCRERSFKKKHVYKKKINNDSDTEVASPVPSTAGNKDKIQLV